MCRVTMYKKNVTRKAQPVQHIFVSFLLLNPFYYDNVLKLPLYVSFL